MSERDVIYLYDGTTEGLFTAIARAIKSGRRPLGIYRREDFQPTLFGDPLFVGVDRKQAERLWRYLRNDLRSESTRNILRAILCDEPETPMLIHDYLKLSLKLRRALDDHQQLEAVADMRDLSSKVGGEIHRFKGLFRFRELKGGVLYAPFEPDYRITTAVAGHFVDRLGAERWIIHDVKRGDAVLWDGELRIVELPEGLISGTGLIDASKRDSLSDDEIECQELWRTFFKHVAIDERANARAQRQFMPRRYWRFLVEMEASGNSRDNRSKRGGNPVS